MSDRRCFRCGCLVDDESYELWLFSVCRSCAAEPAPPRWGDTGTARKWMYFPRWHLTKHPGLPEHVRQRHAARTDGGHDESGTDVNAEDLERVRTRVADAVAAAAAANESAAALGDPRLAEIELPDTHRDLLDAYQAVTRALDRTENVIRTSDGRLPHHHKR